MSFYEDMLKASSANTEIVPSKYGKVISIDGDTCGGTVL